VAVVGYALPQKFGQQGWDIAVALLQRDYTPGPRFQFTLQGQGTDRAQALAEVKKGRGASSIWLGGYPAQQVSLAPTEHPDVNVGSMYGTSGQPTCCDFSGNQLSYAFDTRGGESGSPLFFHGLRNQVVAVHTNFNVVDARLMGQGTLLTVAVLEWIARAVKTLQTQPNGAYTVV
jgi:hypothetical protein